MSSAGRLAGTASGRQLRRREAGWGGSRKQNSELTNRNRIEGRCGGVTRHWTGTPESQTDTRIGKSGGDRAKDQRLTLGDLFRFRDDPEQVHGNVPATPMEKSAEAVVVRVRTKGRIRQPRSRFDAFDGREAASRQWRPKGPLRRGSEGIIAPRRIRQRQNRDWNARGAASAHGMGRGPSLDAACDGGGGQFGKPEPSL